jgi:hypothetical protein
LSRTSKQEGVFTFTNYNKKVFDPTGVLPPITYIHNTAFDFNIGGHYNCSARVRDFIVYTQPGGPGTTWSWSLYARVTCSNGHGASTTGDILLASAGPFAPATFQNI